MTKVDKIKEIMAEGIIIKPLTWFRGREKACGAMYEGKMTVEYEGMKLYFELWYHHCPEQEMTLEEVLEHLQLTGINIGDRYRSSHWYTTRVEGGFFLYRDGWFEDMDLDMIVRSKPSKEELENLGFERIPALDWER